MMRELPLYYETHGNQNNPCIILITGLGGQLIQWPNKFIEALVKQDLYVVTLDNRDSGESPYYDHLGEVNIMAAIEAKQSGKEFIPPYTLNDMADDVYRLMEKLSIQKAHILGSSMGGIIAQTFALRHSEHLSSLILTATSSGDSDLPSATPEVLQFHASSLSNNKQDMESIIESKTKLTRLYDPWFFNEKETRLHHEKMQKRTLSPNGYKRQLLAFLSEQPRGEKLKNVKIKSLIIHGTDDAAFPLAHGKRLHEVLQNSRLKVIEKMGHIISDHLAEKVANVITDFIKNDAREESTMKSRL